MSIPWGTNLDSANVQPCAVALVVFVLVVPPAQSADGVDFQRVIRPILSEHCFECHGPDEAVRQAGLRLDHREGVFTPLDSGAIAVVAGSPDESELVRRITSLDDDTRMPPPDAENPLSPQQIAVLRQWISEGAAFSRHWAFILPQQSLRQVSRDDGEDSNPIDHFVDERLAQERLEPSTPATPEVLCRRIHLDLVGMPPSPSELDDFVAAAETDLPAAVRKCVDRLLASPHFGEKWARHWLDVARYSDSNGFEKDLPREQWAWRDWVIRVINDDMPYDKFLIEQIAGDLLPAPTQDQIIATGFLRNGMLNEEGAIVPEQFRIEGIVDRIDCIGKAVLGLTLQCAQCHSHKFDPISQDEYYGLYAFQNNADDAQSHVFTLEQRKKIDEITVAFQQLNERVRAQRPDWQTELAHWEAAQKQLEQQWEILDTFDETWIGGNNHPESLPDHSVVVLGHPSVSGDMYVRAEHDLTGVTGLRFEALTSSDLPFGGPGRSILGTFAISELTVQVKQPQSELWVDFPLKNTTADFSSQDQKLASFPGADLAEEDDRCLGPVSYLTDGNVRTAWYADRGPGRRNTDSVAVLQFNQPLDLPRGTQIQIKLSMHHNPSPRKEGMIIIGQFRVAVTRSSDPRATSYDHAASRALQIPAKNRSTAEQEAVFTAWREGVAELEPLHDEYDRLWKQYPDDPPTSVLCLSQRKSELHRPTFVLDRGVWNSPLHQVGPHVPKFLHPLSESNEPDRLRFARWLADSRSPLTARVQVNRIWQALFGAGLVETSEDFGTRAPRPEYLKLLDQLAVDFMDRQWSLKQLLRTIVGSEVYQRSSRAAPGLRERDPNNRLLARGPRFRAEAEVVRDIALTASGLMNPKIGGPSIFPPVPQSVLQYNYAPLDYWIPAEGSERYRRSIYTFRKRSMPDPVLSTFDAPNGDTACARRVRSNSPLAALISLNEPVFMEAARALALRVLSEGGPTDELRTDYAYRLCTGRRARPPERAEIVALLKSQRQRLAEGWLSIHELATGDPGKLPELPPGSTPQDAAAWVIAARLILNLDETLNKN